MSASSARSSVALAVIAKTPQPGRVKTRLCPPCTPTQASDIAAAALADTFDAVAAASVARRVVVLDGEPGPWIPGAFDVVVQHGDGFDERLANAAVDVGGPVLIIGMDTPQVRPDALDAAAEQLCADGTDAVIGFADDGGYWIIGLREPRAEVFLGVAMSESTTGAEQLARLDSLGLSTATVGGLCDVDDFDEARSVARQIPDSAFAAAVRRVERDAAAPDDETDQDQTDHDHRGGER